MKVSKKRTCNECRALDEVSYMNCGLGYNNKGNYNPHLGINNIVPQEPCPKPKTWNDYFTAKFKNE